MILDIYDEVGPEGWIKHVTFTSNLNPGHVYKISKVRGILLFQSLK